MQVWLCINTLLWMQKKREAIIQQLTAETFSAWKIRHRYLTTFLPDSESSGQAKSGF